MKQPSNRASWQNSPGLLAVAIAASYWGACLAFALGHVMWRDEWQPLLAARDTGSYAEFLKTCQYWGMDGFFSFCWLISQSGLGIWFFKLVLVSIAAAGVWGFCRFAPFTSLQKALFAFGYFPLYEYGTIMRNYGIILTASIFCTAIIASPTKRPLLFGLCLAALVQTNAFGAVFAIALGATYLFEIWSRGSLTLAFLKRPGSIAGAAVALISVSSVAFSLISLAFFAPDWVTAAGTGGNLRTDSHFSRFLESLPFAARGLLPIPLFGSWNSQVFDPFPWIQVILSVGAVALAIFVLRRSGTATLFFVLIMIGLACLFAQVPWTAMRYHGHYYVAFILALWLGLRCSNGTEPSSAPTVGWQPAWMSAAFTAFLAVHVAVAASFLMQERVVPFSGGREAAEIIRRSAPEGTTVIGDIDAWMMPISGYLGRPIYIASRREFGSFVKIDERRRWLPMSPEELSAVVSERLAADGKDVILVTNYPLAMPPEMGESLGVVERSITDERYFIFRVKHPSGGA